MAVAVMESGVYQSGKKKDLLKNPIFDKLAP
jgi:hypothetical protein